MLASSASTRSEFVAGPADDLRRKHRRVLEAVFTDPVLASIAWMDIESLFEALGATITEGAGSRVHVKMGEVLASFHRPHPEKETDRGAVKSVRRFLKNAGVEP
jgi:HicA toxin of bacterial toxin-antitoxin,